MRPCLDVGYKLLDPFARIRAVWYLFPKSRRVERKVGSIPDQDIEPRVLLQPPLDQPEPRHHPFESVSGRSQRLDTSATGDDRVLLSGEGRIGRKVGDGEHLTMMAVSLVQRSQRAVPVWALGPQGASGSFNLRRLRAEWPKRW